ncbi:MAG: hypothetical protein K9H49_08745 [Bacteroidales bacterium]|nr:hypothetical protein [Bacteroidales bacterium]MCF8389517.1 hypothetical protein [Bacteroidales bacterium]
MSSIRKLKKDINYVSFEILTEVFTYKHFHEELKDEKFDEVIKKVVSKRNELMNRVNHYVLEGDPGKYKQHFRKIREDMVELLLISEELSK